MVRDLDGWKCSTPDCDWHHGPGPEIETSWVFWKHVCLSSRLGSTLPTRLPPKLPCLGSGCGYTFSGDTSPHLCRNCRENRRYGYR